MILVTEHKSSRMLVCVFELGWSKGSVSEASVTVTYNHIVENDYGEIRQALFLNAPIQIFFQQVGGDARSQT